MHVNNDDATNYLSIKSTISAITFFENLSEWFRYNSSLRSLLPFRSWDILSLSHRLTSSSGKMTVILKHVQSPYSFVLFQWKVTRRCRLRFVGSAWYRLPHGHPALKPAALASPTEWQTTIRSVNWRRRCGCASWDPALSSRKSHR